MNIKTVCKGIILKEGKILLVKRENFKRFNGLLELPGGKKRENETEKECVIREVEEETGLKNFALVEKLFDVKLFTTLKNTEHKIKIFMLMKPCIKNLTLYKNTFWCSMNELPNLNLTPYTEELLPLIYSCFNQNRFYKHR
jgi:8-oxo-dGTP diphosphatase